MVVEKNNLELFYKGFNEIFQFDNISEHKLMISSNLCYDYLQDMPLLTDHSNMVIIVNRLHYYECSFNCIDVDIPLFSVHYLTRYHMFTSSQHIITFLRQNRY